jgi:pyruvate dehydrogenase E1 component alpha subunit
VNTEAPQNARGIFVSMLRIRLLEERIADLYHEQEMRCPVHLSIGQEAVAAGVCGALRHGDRVFSGHRSHGHYVAMGGDLPKMMAEIYGKATGCAQGKGGSMHLIDLDAGFIGATPIVASTIPIAVGSAFAAKMSGSESVTVSFLGEGATEEGVFHEAANFAVLKNLPVVFACENNAYSVYSPLEVRQPGGRNVFEQAASYGLESLQIDGNDADEVSRVATHAVDKARAGGGPTFIEFMTYRWREHCGPNYDNDIGYRTEAEYLEWREKDPIAALKTRLTDAGELSDGADVVLRSGIEKEIDRAIDFAKSSPFPDPSTMMSGVYAQMDEQHVG